MAHLIRTGYFLTPSSTDSSSSAGGRVVGAPSPPSRNCLKVWANAAASSSVFPVRASVISEAEAWLMEQPLPWLIRRERVCPSSRPVTSRSSPQNGLTPWAVRSAGSARPWFLGSRKCSRMISRYSSSVRDTVEDLLGVDEGAGEGVHLVRVIVDVEAGAGGAGHPQCAHERLAAVVPGPHGDPLGIQQLAEVVRVQAADVEGDDAAPQRGVPRAVDDEIFHRAEDLQGVGGQRLL